MEDAVRQPTNSFLFEEKKKKQKTEKKNKQAKKQKKKKTVAGTTWLIETGKHFKEKNT